MEQEKKLYNLEISGTDNMRIERYLTDSEYELISSIFDELQTKYESVSIEKGPIDWNIGL